MAEPTATRFQDLLRDFASEAGLPAEAAALSDGQIFLIDDSVELAVLWHEPSASVRLSAPLGELRGDETPEFLRFLLDANLFWSGTNGGTIALDDSTGRLFLQDRQPLETLDRAGLDQSMRRFAGTVQQWSAALAGRQAGTDGADLPEEPSNLRV